MPGLGIIGFRVIDGQYPDQHIGYCVAATRDTGMPPKHTEPAGEVTQELLAAGGSEFRDPMILATRGWCPVRNSVSGSIIAGPPGSLTWKPSPPSPGSQRRSRLMRPDTYKSCPRRRRLSGQRNFHYGCRLDKDDCASDFIACANSHKHRLPCAH
jgi:hypothetical protein